LFKAINLCPGSFVSSGKRKKNNSGKSGFAKN